jgi:hypothetical protein
MMNRSPDRTAALDQYRQAAPGYDRHMRRFERWGRLAVERLELRVDFFVRLSARPNMTTFEGLDRPWRYLERYAPNLDVRDLALGGAYIASGSVEDDAPRRAAREAAPQPPG